MHAREGYGHDTYEDDYVIDNVTCFMKSIFCDEFTSYEVDYQSGSCEELTVTGITDHSKKCLQCIRIRQALLLS